MLVLKKPPALLGPWANGILMTPREFDRTEFERGYRYELINGVLVVSRAPLENERDPNDEMGRRLRNYQEARYRSTRSGPAPIGALRTELFGWAWAGCRSE